MKIFWDFGYEGFNLQINNSNVEITIIWNPITNNSRSTENRITTHTLRIK